MIIILIATFTHADKNNLIFQPKLNSYQATLHQTIPKGHYRK